MISVMLTVSHIVIVTYGTELLIKTLHKIGFGYSINIFFLTFSIKWSILMYQSASVRPYLNDKY